jgi:hypothetical protein
MLLNNTILFLITREIKPDSYIVWVAENLGEYMNVFVMSDNDKPYEFKNATYCHISDEICLAANYKYAAVNEYDIAGDKCARVVISWDKVLYYLNKTIIDYDNVWIMEDDVYIHSVKHALNMFNIHIDTNADYVAKDYFNYTQNPNWCQWYTCNKLFEQKYLYGSFAPLCRLSKRLVNSCDELVKEKGSLGLIEGLFPSLCAKNNFIIWQGWLQNQPIRPCPNVSREEIINTLNIRPDAVFHPVKFSDEEKFELMKEVSVNI